MSRKQAASTFTPDYNRTDSENNEFSLHFYDFMEDKISKLQHTINNTVTFASCPTDIAQTVPLFANRNPHREMSLLLKFTSTY